MTGSGRQGLHAMPCSETIAVLLFVLWEMLVLWFIVETEIVKTNNLCWQSLCSMKLNFLDACIFPCAHNTAQEATRSSHADQGKGRIGTFVTTFLIRKLTLQTLKLPTKWHTLQSLICSSTFSETDITRISQCIYTLLLYTHAYCSCRPLARRMLGHRRMLCHSLQGIASRYEALSTFLEITWLVAITFDTV